LELPAVPDLLADPEGTCRSLTRYHAFPHFGEAGMFSGYIFDVEGTLIDSVAQNLRSLQEGLEQAGIQVPYATLQLYSGLDANQTLQIIAPNLREDQRKQVLHNRAHIYETKYLHSVKAFRGVREVFETLARRGGKLALATDCKGPELKHYLSLLEIDEFIGATACGDDVEHGKPDPRIVGVALRKLGLIGAEAVMIGDTPYDAEAASGAGTAAAGVLTGGFSVEALRGAGCFAVADEISRLLAALEDTKPSATGVGPADI
jgi:HAD superfamily hydrolase (TIGR01549 family)